MGQGAVPTQVAGAERGEGDGGGEGARRRGEGPLRGGARGERREEPELSARSQLTYPPLPFIGANRVPSPARYSPRSHHPLDRSGN